MSEENRKFLEEHKDFLRKIAMNVFSLVSEPENMAYFQKQLKQFCDKVATHEEEMQRIKQDFEANTALKKAAKEFDEKLALEPVNEDGIGDLEFALHTDKGYGLLDGFKEYVYYGQFWGPMHKSVDLVSYLEYFPHDAPYEFGKLPDDKGKLLCDYVLLAIIHDDFTNEKPIFFTPATETQWTFKVQGRCYCTHYLQHNFQYSYIKDTQAWIKRRFEDVKQDLAIKTKSESGGQKQNDKSSKIKKDRILELIREFDDFECVGPSDDPDAKFAMTDSYYSMVTQLKILTKPFITEFEAEILDGIKIEIGDIVSVYEAKPQIDAILPDIKQTIQGSAESVLSSNKAIVEKKKMTAQNLAEQLWGLRKSITTLEANPFCCPDEDGYAREIIEQIVSTKELAIELSSKFKDPLIEETVVVLSKLNKDVKSICDSLYFIGNPPYSEAEYNASSKEAAQKEVKEIKKQVGVASKSLEKELPELKEKYDSTLEDLAVRLEVENRTGKVEQEQNNGELNHLKKTQSPPSDLITFVVAMKEFHVSRPTLQRAVSNNIIKSYRKNNKGAHKVSRQELARNYEKRE